jgi:hypothetical protein
MAMCQRDRGCLPEERTLPRAARRSIGAGSGSFFQAGEKNQYLLTKTLAYGRKK